VGHQRIEISFQNMLRPVRCLGGSIKSLDIKFRDQDHRRRATDTLNQASVTFCVRARPGGGYSHGFFGSSSKRFGSTQCSRSFAAASAKSVGTACT